MKFCLKCQAQLPNDAEYCYQCGTKQFLEAQSASGFKYCMRCGSKLPREAAYCQRCGEAQSIAPSSQPNSAPAYRPAPRQSEQQAYQSAPQPGPRQAYQASAPQPGPRPPYQAPSPRPAAEPQDPSQRRGNVPSLINIGKHPSASCEYYEKTDDIRYKAKPTLTYNDQFFQLFWVGGGLIVMLTHTIKFSYDKLVSVTIEPAKAGILGGDRFSAVFYTTEYAPFKLEGKGEKFYNMINNICALANVPLDRRF